MAVAIPLLGNVAELLAPGEKTVSFWQGRFHIGSAKDNEARTPTLRREPTVCTVMSSGIKVSSPVDNLTATSVLFPQPVDNFVDSSSSLSGRPRRDHKGGERR